MGEIGEHYCDYREPKKQKRDHALKQQEQETNTASTANDKQDDNGSDDSSRRCWDWMVVCGTNHYGKDRSSFSTYIDLPCEIGSCTVLGVGTVELEMVRGPTDPRTYKMVLETSCTPLERHATVSVSARPMWTDRC